MEGIILSNVPVGTEVVIASEEELQDLSNEGYDDSLLYAGNVFQVTGCFMSNGKEMLELVNEDGFDISVYPGEFRFLHPESVPLSVFENGTGPAREIGRS